ncbi:MAG: outer membrane beta-barrel family protein [Bacteroidota bacterium]
MPLFSWAQDYTVSGKVVSKEGIPIPYADVVLQDKDAVVVKWAVTDDTGKYTIENVKSASYGLKVSIFGYTTKTIEINVTTDISEQLVTLEEETVALDEVVVKKPRIERRPDGLVFNIQNTTLSNGTTWNALTKTPYLFATGDKILVGGKDTPLIFINDRRVYLSASELKQLLENTPANMVKSVEVILNPSAKYDADGKAIINVVMNKNLSIGYNGNISAAYEQGVYPKYRLGTSHFYKKDAINMYARYTFNRRKTYALFRNRVDFFDGAVASGNWRSETEDDMTRYSHDFNTNIDYTISDKHTLGFSGIASFIPNKIEFTGSETQAIDSSFYSVNQGKYTRDNIVLSLDYTYDIGKGKELTANVHHTNYRYNRSQEVVTDYFNTADNSLIRNNRFTSSQDQYVKISTAQADYTASGEKGIFEAGAKWAYITFDNRILQENVEGDNMETFDNFLYDETNLAAYMSYDKSWDSWGIKLGLRAENTSIKGVSTSEDQTNTQDYFKLFPTVQLNHKPSDNHNFTFSYAKRISRPPFGTLNPFRLFLNDNTYVTGNPNLLPTIQHRFNFTYNLKRALTFNLYFHQSIDPIIQELPYIDNEDNKVIYRNDNLDETTEYGMSVQWSKTLNSWWEISIYSSLFNVRSAFFAPDSNEIFDVTSWTTFHRVDNYFTLSKTFTGDIGFRYNNRYAYGNYIMGEQSNLYIGLQKTLWNKRATLSLYVNDIFNKLAFTTETRYLDQYMFEYSDFEYRTFEINFTYKFGNYRLRTNRKGISKEERDRI